jgi:hypothetical protein
MGLVTVSANVKKILTITTIVVLAYFVISRPSESAGIVQQLLGMIQSWAEALVTFLQSLFA